MAVSLEKFREQLTASGLMTADEIDTIVAGLGQENQPADAETLAKLLVKEKQLTAFQAQQIWQGKGQQLVLGNYIITEKLGQGGMGMVLKATHKLMKRDVALKVLSPAAVKNNTAVQRFLREVEAAAKLTHPNIVAAHDADQANGNYFLIMEYVAGRDLSEVVKKQGPAKIEQAIDCILQAARGLEYAHQHGVIHRDIKPANLLLDTNGTVKVLDMGLARIDEGNVDAATQAGLTGTGTIMGTIDYMAPEQAEDTRSAGPQADIYSLGASLYYLLTGKPMVKGDAIGKKLKMLMTGVGLPQSIIALRPEISAEVDAVFQKMTAFDMADRYQTMTEVIADFETLQAGGTPDSASTPGIQPVAARSDDSAMQSFLNKLGDGTATAGPTVLASPKTEAGAETMSSSVDEATRPAFKQTATFNKTVLEPKNRKLLIGGGVAACLLVGAIVWGLNRGGDGKPPASGGSNPPGKNPVGNTPGSPGEPDRAIAPFTAEEAKAHQQAWAEFLGLDVKKEIILPGGAKMTFMLIPPGEFMMGSTEEEIKTYLSQEIQYEFWEDEFFPTEAPQHLVRITKPFYIGKFEVTNQQFEIFAKESSTSWSRPSQGIDDAMPAGNMTDKMMLQFCDWLSRMEGNPYRLPTEAEWEYACRAGTTTAFAFGDSISSQDANFNGAYPFRGPKGPDRRKATPVGTFRPNAFSLYDMHGNVWETCSDVFLADYYARSPKYDPPGPGGNGIRVQRGGDYEESRGVAVRSAVRLRYKLPYYSSGFRVAMTIDTAKLKTPQTTPADPDRAAAEWVLGIGGLISTDVDPKRKLSKIEQLPEQPFRLTLVDVNSIEQVTNDSLKRLKGLASLSELYVHGTMVSDAGLVHLRGLENLAVLYILDNQISDVGLEHLSGLRNLTLLQLHETQVTGTGLKHLHGLTNLQELYLNSSQINDAGLQQFQKLTNLRILFLDLNPISDDGLEYLKRLTKLEQLTLSHNQVGDTGIENLKGLTNLTSLKIDRTKISDAGLKYLSGLTKLEQLSLRLTQIGDPGLEYLKGLTSLSILMLHKTKVTPAGVAALQKALPNCNIEWDGAAAKAPPPAKALFDSAQAKAHQEAWAKHLGEPVVTTNSIGMKLAIIPPGTFEFVYKHGKADITHSRPFRLAIHEVTQAQWKTVMGTEPWKEIAPVANAAASGITWTESADFCRKLTERERRAGKLPDGWEYRLPTSAEWDFACSAGTTGRFWFGDGGRAEEFGWFESNSKKVGENYPHPVGLKQPNPWGLYDMFGNVWELCRDWHGELKLKRGTDPMGPDEGTKKLCRGGSWMGHVWVGGLGGARLIGVYGIHPDAREIDKGLRVALCPLPGTIIGRVDSSSQKPTNAAAPPPANAPFNEAQAKAHQKAWADHLDLPVEKQITLPGAAKMQFRLIPPGEFMMGATVAEQKRYLEQTHADDDQFREGDRITAEKNSQHLVRITKPFYFGKYEVSQAEWQGVMKTNPSRANVPEHAVGSVSWNDVKSFLDKLNEKPPLAGIRFALPTEAQWEYACRAGTTTTWHFGENETKLQEYGWFKANAAKNTHRGGQLRPNPFGLHDMYGNMFELCADWYDLDYYAKSPVIDPIGPTTGEMYVARGGSWNHPSRNCNSTYRRFQLPDSTSPDHGVRLVMTIDPSKLSASRHP